jgi:hypothetical protein
LSNARSWAVQRGGVWRASCAAAADTRVVPSNPATTDVMIANAALPRSLAIVRRTSSLLGDMDMVE